MLKGKEVRLEDFQIRTSCPVNLLTGSSGAGWWASEEGTGCGGVADI